MKAPRFRINDPHLQKAFDALANHMDSLPAGKQIIAGENIRKTERDGEIIIHGTPAGATAGGGTWDCGCPFSIFFTAEEDTDPQTFTFGVDYGMANGSVVERNDELATGIDPSVETPTPMYVILNIAFSTTGGVTDTFWEESESLPDPPTPLEDEFISSAKVVLGVRTGTDFIRILSCANVACYPIVIGSSPSGDSMKRIYSYEVYGV